MINRNTKSGVADRPSLRIAAFLFAHSGEPLRLLHAVPDRRVESVKGALTEEDSVDDLTISGGDAEGVVEDDFDIQDLLLDESD